MSEQVCFDIAGEMGVVGPAVVLATQVISAVVFALVPKEKQRKFHKLLLVYLVTVVLGTSLAGALYGNWLSWFFKANLLAYAQVFGHQVYKNIGR